MVALKGVDLDVNSRRDRHPDRRQRRGQIDLDDDDVRPPARAPRPHPVRGPRHHAHADRTKSPSCGSRRSPEGRRIFSRMTVLENLQMGADRQPTRRPSTKISTRVFTLFPRLKERISQRGGTLSGGEQQMLAIGRALMSRPRLLMLDEPSLGLAPLLVKQIFRAIRALNERDKLTVFLVEQNAFHALRLAHRGYVMVNGLITLSGTGRELLRTRRRSKRPISRAGGLQRDERPVDLLLRPRRRCRSCSSPGSSAAAPRRWPAAPSLKPGGRFWQVVRLYGAARRRGPLHALCPVRGASCCRCPLISLTSLGSSLVGSLAWRITPHQPDGRTISVAL